MVVIKNLKGLFNRYKTFIKLLVSSSILILLISFFDMNIISAFERIQNHNYIFISLLIPVLINPLISNNRWRFFLSAQGISEKFFSLVKISFISIFLGIILPSTTGSDAIRIYQIEKRQNHLKGAGGASVIIERLLGFLILSFLGIIGAFIAVLNDGSIYLLYLTVFIHIAILIVFIILKNGFIYRYINRYFSKTKKAKGISNYLRAIYLAINIFPIRKVLPPTIPLILAFQLSTIICSILLFYAFNVDVPIFYHFTFMPLIQIFSIIPITISGFGIREGGFVYFYGLLGVDENISFLISLLYYAVLMIVPAFIGMIFYLFDGMSYKQIEEEQINNEKEI